MSSLERSFPSLGTFVEFSLSSPTHSEDQLLDLSIDMQALIQRAQNLMSFHDPDSELSFLNQNAHLAPRAISPELHEVLTFALQLASRTRGLFDPTIAPILQQADLLPPLPSTPDSQATWRDIHLTGHTIFFHKPLHLDLGGIAKGWAVDRSLTLAASAGVKTTVNAGGDLRMTHWKNEPVLIRETGQILTMQGPALATSSSANFHSGNDLVDPETRKIIPHTNAVSVFAPSCMTADALTKIALLHHKPASILNDFKAQLAPQPQQ